MANGGSDSANLGGGDGDGDKSNSGVSKIICSFKSCFLANDFAEVERAIVSREEKLKLKIEELKQNEVRILEKFEAERLEKMRLRTELDKCRTECKEMGNEVSKLRDENSGLARKAKNAEERREEMLAEVKELGKKVTELGDKESEIVNLMVRNHELTMEKDNLEDELTVWKKKFEELDKRVLILESDLPLLRNTDDSKSNVIGADIGNSATVGVKCEEVAKVEDVSFGDSLVKANGKSQNAGKIYKLLNNFFV